MLRPGEGTHVNPNKLFEKDDDVDIDTSVNESFRTRIPPAQPSKPACSNGSHIAALEQQRQAMTQKQKEIEKRTLESSFRCIDLLGETEDIGIAAAVELSRQGDQLQNTNKRLDEMNSNLNHSQKHLNGIKSVFHGLKNYISGKSDQTPPRIQSTVSMQSPGPSNRLGDTVDNPSQVNSDEHFRSHPATRLRELDAQASAITDSECVNQILENNLEQMGHSISRLKGLGIALGEEIEKQSDLIDTIQIKVDNADIKIGKQNKMMNKILGK